jgi:hypothetical protein
MVVVVVGGVVFWMGSTVLVVGFFELAYKLLLLDTRRDVWATVCGSWGLGSDVVRYVLNPSLGMDILTLRFWCGDDGSVFVFCMNVG